MATALFIALSEPAHLYRQPSAWFAVQLVFCPLCTTLCMPFSTQSSFFLCFIQTLPTSCLPVPTNQPPLLPFAYFFLFSFVLSIFYPKPLALASLLLLYLLLPAFHIESSTSHVHILPFCFLNLKANLLNSSSSAIPALPPTPLSISSRHPSPPPPPLHPLAHNHPLIRLLLHPLSTFLQAAPAVNSLSD